MRHFQDRGFAFLTVGILDDQVPAVGREAHRDVQIQVQRNVGYHQIGTVESFDAIHVLLAQVGTSGGNGFAGEDFAACKFVEEGQKMVQAARKYNRIVQAGTMQRSGGYFQKAAEIVKSGRPGAVTCCHAFQCGMTEQKRFGNPPDGDPPADLDWDLWLGPAPKVPFNPNRWGVKAATFPTFRYFWDYAG